MLTLSKKYEQLYKESHSSDNRGLTIVELVIVIAIMAVLLGVMGFSLSMLVGTEAKQAATKMDAQLNDIKTGAMSRASEYMVIRYIDFDAADHDTQEAMAKLGADRSGYYAEKRVDTITNDPTQAIATDSVKWTYEDVELARIGSKKVDITIAGTTILTDGSNGVRIEYDRRTGRLLDAVVVLFGSNANVVTNAIGFTEDSTATLDKMTFKAGMRTYEIDIDAETGKHKLVK